MGPTKDDVRRDALAERNALRPESGRVAATAIARRVLDLPEWRDAGTVGVYVPIGSEIDTRLLLETAIAGMKRVVIPRTLVEKHALALHEIERFDDLKPGTFGVPEPDPNVHELVPRDEVDLVIVPGIAFDRRGHRLGYGRGYFDRLLHKFHGVKLGLTTEALLLDKVPSERHDVRMDLVVTEHQVLDARQKSRSRGSTSTKSPTRKR